ncbi:MAG TPA: co-chaperone GroES [Nitrospirota bacterium]|nr:co-chaperone GroES [Nitrospirota bacterium]
MRITPLHDWAVIRPSGADEITAGGIIIPDTAKEKPHEGVVVVIGPGAFEKEEKFKKKKVEKKERRFIPTTVKPGDRVLYERFAGQTYTVNGEDLILVRERDILGILPERQPRQAPLQIPAITSTYGATALMTNKRPLEAIGAAADKKAAKPAKKTVKKTTIKPKKKVVKKTAKKAVKASGKKATGRKASAKKSTKKK